MSNVVHIDLYSGEDRTVTLAARDSSNAVVDLTSKTVTVYVGMRPNDPTVQTAVFTKSGTIVSASAGTYSIDIDADDTADLEGDYRYQAKTTDASGNVAVVTTGRFRVRRDIEA